MSRKRHLMPGPVRDRVAAVLKAKYERGTSIRTLAEETGRSYTAVHKLLTYAGTTFRPRGGVRRGESAS
ncbi:helix-turn-helix domain-containing protein [Streptomyces celluloflavus]|uniref:helix-turn-helix domain-containing protein n=1 Tax=Streptomyces celluloflavus TaxID=58344 RepID=UPI00364FE853